MIAGADWLPPLVLLEDSKGNWTLYEEVLYGWFRRDFLDSLPPFPGKRVGLKRYPLQNGKEATFWHLISEGQTEKDRKIDLRRCERIRWPRPIIEAFCSRRPQPNDRIVWWRNQRRKVWRFVLALQDFRYLAVVADRGEYVLPWTAYCVEHEHQRERLRKEYEAYWKSQNC